MNCAEEVALGQSAYLSRDLVKARLHFTRAHGACHERKRDTARKQDGTDRSRANGSSCPGQTGQSVPVSRAAWISHA